MTKDLERSPRSVIGPHLRPEAQVAVDAALGTLGAALGAAVVVARTGARATAPVTRFLWRPPLVPRSLQPASFVSAAARAGRADRDLLARRAALLLDALAPALVEAVVARLDLNDLVAEHVDLDALVATVDLDGAVARVDLDGAVARVDLDGVVARVDLDGAVARVDLDAIVARVDLNAAVALVDIDAAVARVDLDAAVGRVDLDAAVARVDLDGAVALVDLDAIIDRIDLVGIVGEVLDELDLPAIIRDSTGSMASETVHGVRMTGITADDAISRVVDRALFRRRRQAAREETDQ